MDWRCRAGRIAAMEAQNANLRARRCIRTKVDAIYEATVEHRGFARAIRLIGHTALVLLGGFAGALAHEVLVA